MDTGPRSSVSASFAALADAAAADDEAVPVAQAFVVGACSFQRTVPRVTPAINVLGLGAAGRAGKASVSSALGALVRGAEREDVVVEVLDVTPGRDAGVPVPHTGADVVVLEAEEEEAEDRGGNGFPDDKLPGRAPLRPTADRDD